MATVKQALKKVEALTTKRDAAMVALVGIKHALAVAKEELRAAKAAEKASSAANGPTATRKAAPRRSRKAKQSAETSAHQRWALRCDGC